MRTFHRRTQAIAALLGLTVLSGCAGLTPRTAVTIDSDPQGASVRVSGKLVGVTPVTLDIDTVFPNHWTDKADPDEEGIAFYRRMETVDITKDGCELYTKRFMSEDVMKDHKITLRCDPNYRAPATAEGGVEQRLRRLDELRGKGLISDEEFNEQRRRILNTL